MFSFFINGTFSSEPSVSDEIIINLESPSNAQAFCYPKIGFKSITCYIDSCFNILNRTHIIVPVNPPSSSKFTFPNWKEFFYQDNVVIKWVTCLPLGETTFSPESIKSNGCSGQRNAFEINGNWEDETKKPSSSFFKLKLENEQKDIALCNYNVESSKELKCTFEGEGYIKFEEQFFLFSIERKSYKIQKHYSSVHVNECNYSIRTNSNWMFLLILSILLF